MRAATGLPAGSVTCTWYVHVWPTTGLWLSAVSATRSTGFAAGAVVVVAAVVVAGAVDPPPQAAARNTTGSSARTRATR